MSTHNLNDDTKGAFRVTLRAVAKPGLALSCDGWRPKPRRGRRSNVQTTTPGASSANAKPGLAIEP